MSHDLQHPNVPNGFLNSNYSTVLMVYLSSNCGSKLMLMGVSSNPGTRMLVDGIFFTFLCFEFVMIFEWTEKN